MSRESARKRQGRKQEIKKSVGGRAPKRRLADASAGPGPGTGPSNAGTKKRVMAERARATALRLKGVGAGEQPEEPSRDEYGAAGGMPFSNHASAVKGDRSNSKQVARELSWAEFGRYIQDLARQAAGFKPDAVVGIAHGGVFVGGAVASALKVEFYPVRLLRRSRESETRRPSGLSDEMPTELSGCRVLVVDDVCSSGDSLEMAGRLARAAGCSKVKTAALVTRPKGARPDYSALTTEALFVFPWDYQAVVEDERFEQKRMGGSGRSGSKRKPASLEAHDDVVLGV